jgi:RNA polymerase sigma factor (sigma-70 family)
VRPVSDRELWQRASAGDDVCFGVLFDRHADAIYNYCFRRTGDWSLAEDLTASVFLTAWRRRRQVRFTEEGAVLPWLYGVATNVIRNDARGRRRLALGLRRLALESSTHLRPDTSVEAEEGERMREILALVEPLPRGERDAFALCVLAGVTYAEAAIALEIPIGTVRSRVARARSRIRELSVGGGHEQDRADESSPDRTDGHRASSAVPPTRT